VHDSISEYLRKEVLRRYEESGLSQRRFERSLGLREWSLKGMLDKSAPRVPSIDIAKEVADALGLDFYIGPPRPSDGPPADLGEYTPVPVLAAELAAGDGAENGDEHVIASLAFRRDWLKQLGIAPGGAVIARARGDSMWPTISHGDVVLIDRLTADPPKKLREPNDARPAPIYALLDDGAARIKRLEWAAKGTLAVLSDNPLHPPEFRPIEAVSIIGKVRWWGHTNRE
jgi:SOS-response transcriptional repressor LexA